ncbi:MAG: hypothetical protein F6K18_19915 [Okeania sp. SIO2C2]|uniref:hypothetical protein n=1 Tax=Okeania sp. SIO2C2 TaxID=2607787 RepID=UPI0013BA9854|nr:hypothetical protein [Okeania sp. SIO2C2]NEP88918.1 hypothetical protein [Okeania sp. SIO2C2]
MPNLWILATSASEKLINSFGFSLDQKNWISGVYILPVGWKTNLIVINQLPVIPINFLVKNFRQGKNSRISYIRIG